MSLDVKDFFWFIVYDERFTAHERHDEPVAHLVPDVVGQLPADGADHQRQVPDAQRPEGTWLSSWIWFGLVSSRRHTRIKHTQVKAQIQQYYNALDLGYVYGCALVVFVFGAVFFALLRRSFAEAI